MGILATSWNRGGVILLTMTLSGSTSVPTWESPGVIITATSKQGSSPVSGDEVGSLKRSAQISVSWGNAFPSAPSRSSTLQPTPNFPWPAPIAVSGVTRPVSLQSAACCSSPIINPVHCPVVPSGKTAWTVRSSLAAFSKRMKFSALKIQHFYKWWNFHH